MGSPGVLACTVSAALALAPASRAGTPAPVRPIAQCPIGGADLLPSLTASFEAADAARFGETAARILEAVRGCGALPPGHPDLSLLASIDPGVDYALIAWHSAPASRDAIHVALVHRGIALAGRTLAGIGPGTKGRLFQIFVAASPLDRLRAAYVSEEAADPVAARLPAFAALAATPWLGPAVMAAPTSTPAPEPAGAWASVSQVHLPFRRASIDLSLEATTFHAPGEVARMALALERRLIFVEVPHAACATALARSLGGLLRSLAAECAAGAAACEDRAAAPFSEAFTAHERLCTDGVRTAASANLQALRRVDTAFRTLVSEMEPRRVAEGVRLQNVPRRRFSLGVGAAYLIGRERGAGTPDAGAAPPPSRPVSLAIVNGAFRRYDDTRVTPGWNERIRWFAGAAVTPEPGAAAGLSVLLVRGLAVNAGAVLFAAGRSAREDQPPGGVSPRTRAGRVERRGFVGLSYNFR